MAVRKILCYVKEMPRKPAKKDKHLTVRISGALLAKIDSAKQAKGGSEMTRTEFVTGLLVNGLKTLEIKP